MKTAFSSFIYSRRGIYGILHILILLMSLFLVISISIDTFHNIPFLNQGSYLKIQFWICGYRGGLAVGQQGVRAVYLVHHHADGHRVFCQPYLLCAGT